MTKLNEVMLMADLVDQMAADVVTKTMLDIGGHHGSAFSPLLDRSGWLIHTFEPDDANRQVLCERFGSNERVVICALAVSDADASRQAFYRSGISSGISTLSPFHSTHRPEGTVDTVTLKTYCERHDIKSVQYLKTDTEGFDLFVLRGFDWNRFRPLAIMVEFDDRKTRHLGYVVEDLIRYLEDHDYTVWISEWNPVSEYGTEHSWRSLKPASTRLADRRGWGNLLAFSEPPNEEALNSAAAMRVEG